MNESNVSLIIELMTLAGVIMVARRTSDDSTKTRRLDATKIVYHELFMVIRDAMDTVTQAYLHAISCKRTGTANSVIRDGNGQAKVNGTFTPEEVIIELHAVKDLIQNRRWVIGEKPFNAFVVVVDNALKLLNTAVTNEDSPQETSLRQSYDYLCKILEDKADLEQVRTLLGSSTKS